MSYAGPENGTGNGNMDMELCTLLELCLMTNIGLPLCLHSVNAPDGESCLRRGKDGFDSLLVCVMAHAEACRACRSSRQSSL